MTGARVGNWYLEAEIGRGALGIVYRARGYDDPGTPRGREGLHRDDRTGCRVRAEVRGRDAAVAAARSREHRKYYDSGTHGGLAYVACELVEGEDYRQPTRRRPPSVARGALGRRAGRTGTQACPQSQRPAPRSETRALHADGRRHAEGARLWAGEGRSRTSARHNPRDRFRRVHSPRNRQRKAAHAAQRLLFPRRRALYSRDRPATVRRGLAGRVDAQAVLHAPGTARDAGARTCRPELDEFICVLLDKNPAADLRPRRPCSRNSNASAGSWNARANDSSGPRRSRPDTAEVAALPAALAGAQREATRARAATAHEAAARGDSAVPARVWRALVAPFAWPSTNRRRTVRGREAAARFGRIRTTGIGRSRSISTRWRTEISRTDTPRRSRRLASEVNGPTGAEASARGGSEGRSAIGRRERPTFGASAGAGRRPGRGAANMARRWWRRSVRSARSRGGWTWPASGWKR